MLSANPQKGEGGTPAVPLRVFDRTTEAYPQAVTGSLRKYRALLGGHAMSLIAGELLVAPCPGPLSREQIGEPSDAVSRRQASVALMTVAGGDRPCCRHWFRKGAHRLQNQEEPPGLPAGPPGDVPSVLSVKSVISHYLLQLSLARTLCDPSLISDIS
jgi:hypothetical protein